MFSDRLKELIRKKEVSRYQVAKATGVTEATLSNYINGKGNPNTSIVKQLADYFEVDFEWLFHGEGSEETRNSQLSDPNDKVYHSNYSNTRKQIVTSSDLSVLVAFFEKQLNAKDALISHLLSLIDDKLDTLSRTKNKI